MAPSLLQQKFKIVFLLIYYKQNIEPLKMYLAVGFAVLIEVTMKSPIFWDIMMCSPLLSQARKSVKLVASLSLHNFMLVFAALIL
jgi:hypothetical protein